MLLDVRREGGSEGCGGRALPALHEKRDIGAGYGYVYVFEQRRDGPKGELQLQLANYISNGLSGASSIEMPKVCIESGGEE